MASKKKIPLRMCVGCQEMYDKREMIRIVRTPEGEFVVDETGKKSGRGAYVCKRAECFAKAVKEKRFERSFKGRVEPEIYEELKTRIFPNEQ